MDIAASIKENQAAPASAARVWGRTFAWFLVAGLLLIDVIWSNFSGLTLNGAWKVAGILLFCLALSYAYRHRSRCIADWTEGLALWTLFTTSGCVLTYLCATCALPFQDAFLANIDRAIGFEWLQLRKIVIESPLLYWILFVTYASLFWQIVLSILYFPANEKTERGRELLILAVLTMIPTAVISALFPALGPLTDGPHVAHMLSLRAEGPWEFSLLSMEGIITMPSYHTVLAVLFTYAYRGAGMIGWSIAGLNLVMLLSIPPIGGHYLSDMIAGGVIAVLCILGLRWWSSKAAPENLFRVSAAAQRILKTHSIIMRDIKE
jgi:membrane-associated phospholipid phosphatase